MLPSSPADASAWLTERFLAASFDDIRRLDEALLGCDYMAIANARAALERRAHADRRELPGRDVVIELGRLARRGEPDPDGTWLGAELALHCALLATSGSDLLSPAEYACLLSPAALALG